MKLGSIEKNGECRLVAFEDGYAIDLNRCDETLPSDLIALIKLGTRGLDLAAKAVEKEKAAGFQGSDRIADVTFKAPHRPGKMVCVGGNYEDYRKLIGLPAYPIPLMFMKSTDAVIGHNETIKLPNGYGIFYHEWEFSCVISKTCRGIKPDEVNDHIFGYTIVNDITGRSLEATERELQPLGKNMDTFAPMGPWVVTSDAMPDDLYSLSTIRRRNGKTECESNTSNMRMSFDEIVAFVANFMTLQPGDVVTTATPPSGAFYPGDVIEAEIEGIGTIVNPVEGIDVDMQYARAIGLKDVV